MIAIFKTRIQTIPRFVQTRGIQWISFFDFFCFNSFVYFRLHDFLLQFIRVFQATRLVSALNLNILQVIFGVALIAEADLAL